MLLQHNPRLIFQEICDFKIAVLRISVLRSPCDLLVFLLHRVFSRSGLCNFSIVPWLFQFQQELWESSTAFCRRKSTPISGICFWQHVAIWHQQLLQPNIYVFICLFISYSTLHTLCHYTETQNSLAFLLLLLPKFYSFICIDCSVTSAHMRPSRDLTS